MLPDAKMYEHFDASILPCQGAYWTGLPILWGTPGFGFATNALVTCALGERTFGPSKTQVNPLEMLLEQPFPIVQDVLHYDKYTAFGHS